MKELVLRSRLEQSLAKFVRQSQDLTSTDELTSPHGVALLNALIDFGVERYERMVLPTDSNDSTSINGAIYNFEYLLSHVCQYHKTRRLKVLVELAKQSHWMWLKDQATAEALSPETREFYQKLRTRLGGKRQLEQRMHGFLFADQNREREVTERYRDNYSNKYWLGPLFPFF